MKLRKLLYEENPQMLFSKLSFKFQDIEITKILQFLNKYLLTNPKRIAQLPIINFPSCLLPDFKGVLNTQNKIVIKKGAEKNKIYYFLTQLIFKYKMKLQGKMETKWQILVSGSLIVDKGWRKIYNLANKKIRSEDLTYIADHITQSDDQRIELSLQYNRISFRGCLYLSDAKWKAISRLNLSHNQIGDKGCKYLSQGDWNHLDSLYLNSNSISSNGCKHISKAKWPNLRILSMNDNEVQFQGLINLSKMDSKNLTQISLKHNKINEEGCKKLVMYQGCNTLNHKHLNVTEFGIYLSRQKLFKNSSWRVVYPIFT